jgi:alpha-N-arabinofuranosidase
VWIVGPHNFRKDGFYYLTAAEGGTAEGHSEVVLRSRSVTGPYVPFAGNPILTQRDLPRGRAMPITSAGHAELVETGAGDWWATFLAVRPYAGDYYNTGRETFLLPVRWENGWPRITSPGQTIPYAGRRPTLPPQPAGPVPTAGAFAVRDRFDGPKLPPYWMMMRNPRESWWSLSAGMLKLKPRPVALGDNANPSFLARRQQHIDATASTELRYCPRGDGDEAGIAALQNDAAWYLLAVAQQGGKTMLVLKRRATEREPADGIVIASAPLPAGCGAPIRLRIAARGEAYDFSYAAAGGSWRTLQRGADGRMLSTKAAGGFVGAVFGLYAHGGSR